MRRFVKWFDRRRTHVLLLILYWPALFVLAHIPIPQMVYAARVSDKALHYVAYLILTFLLWFAISPSEKVNWRGKKIWILAAIIAAYGVADEVIQGLVGRNCDLGDFGADLIGAAAALVICWLLSYWPAFLTVTGVSIFALTNLARTNMYALLPAGTLLFNFAAYGLFTGIWIRTMRWLNLGQSRQVWPWMAATVPLALLVVVEIFAIILNRFWGIPAMGAAAGCVALVICGAYLARQQG
jgi:hypothetical protein